MLVRWAVITSSVLALAACESHGSAQRKAAVVNGADPARQAQVYNAQNDAYRRQQAAEARRGSPPRAAPAADVEPVALQPVSAIYLSETGTRENNARASQPARQVRRGDIVVRPGDTVYAIGRRYDVPPKSIIAVNRLRAPYALSIGQTLKLPKSATLAAEPAPVRKVVAQDALYQVRQGDTLYSISRSAGVPVQTIAQANNILPPYDLSPGQQLLLPQARMDANLYAANSRARKSAPKTAPARVKAQPQSVAELAKTVSYTAPKSKSPDAMFEWPVRGKVIASYGMGDLGRRNDGVNIAAPSGTPVRAAADGEVVYRGSELDGFGNLLLVKHADGFVTAYAHNDSMLVKKGDKIRQGQVIAKVGQSGAVSSPQLHFEIRQNLKSVDPVAMLGSK